MHSIGCFFYRDNGLIAGLNDVRKAVENGALVRSNMFKVQHVGPIQRFS